MFVKDIRRNFYEEIIKRGKVLVLVNHDVDGICGLKILQFLFETDNVQYSVLPVGCPEELFKIYNSHKANVKSIVLINLGGSFDVRDELEVDPSIKIFIADSHRPIQFYNIFRDDVYVLCRPDDNEPVPDYEDVIWDSDDEEGHETTGDNRRKPGGPHRSLAELMKRSKKRKEKAEWAANANEIIGKYNQFAYYGDSVSETFFKLAWKLSRDSNQLLWLAIIGIYDQITNHKIDSERHNTYIETLRSHVTRLSHLRSERAGGALNELTGDGDNQASASTSSKNQSLSITHVEDLQLTLYRHWSLFESMRHTVSICSKFKIWTPKGHKRLLEFLAELGIPLIQSKQKFTSMEIDYKKNMLEWIKDLCGNNPKYDLDVDTLFNSNFIASKGYKFKYCASDVSLGIRALLESPEKDKTPNTKFLEGLDALSWSNTHLLEMGIELAKAQSQAVLNQVQHLLDMNAIARAGDCFFYTIIKESAPDVKIFSYPASLLSLARFLLNAFVSKTKMKDASNLAFVIITPDVNHPGSGLVAGIPPLAEKSARNFFADCFRIINEREKIRFDLVPDFYDQSVARLPFNETSCAELLSELQECFGMDQEDRDRDKDDEDDEEFEDDDEIADDDDR